jgi:ribonucleoside-diphosphate reductase alpha chain
MEDTVAKMSDHIYVTKRNGDRVPVSFNEVLSRIQKLADGLDHVNPDLVAQKVCTQIQDGIKTSALDEFAAEVCAMMQARFHPNYGKLAARLVIDNHQKTTPSLFSDCVDALARDELVNDDFVWSVAQNRVALNAACDYSRDFMFEYFGFKTLENGYMLRTRDGKPCERPQHMWMRVAVQLHGENLTKVIETYDALSQGFFIHATPTLFNSGTKHPQLSSCFLVHMESDSIRGIYNTLTECAEISKWAGGIGLSVHNVRARGADIKGTNGKSTGLTPMLKVFNDTAKYVNQGGKRNGSFAVYLEPWHADIEEFLRLKLNTGNDDERARDLFYGLWICDLFMERVEQDGVWTLFTPDECPGLSDSWGEEFNTLYTRYEREHKGAKEIPAKKLWQMILDAQIQTGTPYLLYKDACNAKSNQQNLGTIKSSNLCVAPETMVLTDAGQFPIATLDGKTVRVWNGDAFSDVIVTKTGVDQELVDVELSDGRVLTCTPYHKFLVSESYDDKRSIANALRVDASNLKPGMRMKKTLLPTIVAGSEPDFKYAYTHGFFCGDGTYSTGRPALSLYGEKKDLVSYLSIRTMTGVEDASGRLNTMLPLDINAKFAVPLNTSIQCRLEWLAGYIDADGSVSRNGTNESIQVTSIEYAFLKNVQSMLVTLGVHSKLAQSFPARKTMLPDGHGGYAEFDYKPLWRLLVSSSGLHHLSTLGFKTHRLAWTARKPQRDAEQFVTVVQVISRGRRDDTYCFNEPINHAGVFNGILTGNCTEIIEYTSPEETAVCNLGSLALPKFVQRSFAADGEYRFNFEELRKYTAILARNLDIVVDKTYYPTEKCRTSNLRHRPIGIGVQGLADVFAMLRIPWASQKAADLNREIFENIYYAAATQSMLGAGPTDDWRGVPLSSAERAYPSFSGSPVSQGKMQYHLWGETPKSKYLNWDALAKLCASGMRNSLLIAPMPTASTSQILGNNECFEPFTSNLYSRRVLSGEFIVINKYLVEDLVARGMWTPDVRTEIIANNGSIQSMVGLPGELRELYRTAWEIPMKTLINMARDRAPFICQSQSLNLFIADPTYSKLSSMHFYAWKQGLKTGCYYLRTKAAAKAQQFTVEPSACVSCSA